MESLPDSSDTNCLICISPCKELSTDLFLYNCKCVYVIHKKCFVDWRRISKTNRICIICHEQLLPIRRNQENIINIHAIQEHRYYRCVNNVIVPILVVFIVVILAFIIQYFVTVIIPAFMFKKNSFLNPFQLEHLNYRNRDEL